MGEVVNVLVAFAVIVFLFRWVTSSSESGERSPADTLGFRPKNITQDMIDTISNMFPDIPTDNVRYDLLRTGSVELTSNKILERGFLDAPPPAYYTLYPREPTPSSTANRSSNSNGDATPKKLQETLISRYQLEGRVVDAEPVVEDRVGGKAVWEDSPDKREASLRERKAQMILAARQRMLAQQEAKS
ncbi:hypothetical protein K443DRAFT_678661 [Laccaria amethystina LaAM-08-1]|uniref:CUE domain-containing protein n=1 Tax=Laccaria amethystina LaAM-08-1 TaxID=1095629 RepID=A0A0C9XU11_9AGAR|nr:hypothetical protein K443DRAFT_678661 [Laccaria amethystina LaAM-08-1]